MHEVSLCQHLARAVSRAAGPRTVEVVHVDVGALRQVVPDAMTFAWGFVVRGTTLDGCRLDMRELPAVIRCEVCGADARLGPELGFDCRSCGSADTVVVSGEQFLLRAIDVAVPESDGRPTWRAAHTEGAHDGAISPAR